MKIKYFALSLLACVGMMSCSNNDDLAGDGGQKGDGDVARSYVAVNILNTNSDGTRVAGAEYEDGKGNENKITSARFYFFKSDGSAYPLSTASSVSGTTDNYIDVTPANSTDGADENIDKVFDAVLVFNGKTNELPASIVAVINSSLGTGSKSLSDLKIITGNYGVNAAAEANEGNFVMSNSVYASEGTSSAEVIAVNIDGKIATSEADAKANPVDIYVERAVAKVKLTLDGTEASTTDKYKVTEDGSVFAKVLGWAVTSDTRTSNLLKSINTTWTNDGLGFTWNDAPYHRSYWAATTVKATNDKSFNEIVEELKGEGTDNIAVGRYCQENTSTDKTNLIVVAQLQNSDGTAHPIYKYFGVDYTSENDIKTLIANKYRDTYFTKEGETYNSIAPSALQFTATAPSGSTIKDYEVVAQVATGTYYKKSTSGYEEATLEEINAELAKNPAQVSTDGYVYYFTPIKHLGTSGKTGEYGIVRNHIYSVTVDGIKGYGTPVFDPDKDIVPTVPVDENTYIAARINVLSWRVVSNSVILGQ